MSCTISQSTTNPYTAFKNASLSFSCSGTGSGVSIQGVSVTKTTADVTFNITVTAQSSSGSVTIRCGNRDIFTVSLSGLTSGTTYMVIIKLNLQ